MKYINILFAIFLLMFTACENDIDNYDAPNGGIKGTIYDETTGEPIPLPVQGEAGVMINMFEQNTKATEAINFRAKQDGTYQHSKLFNCDYKIVAEGPFVNKCEGMITVKGQTTFDLKAVPYARISAEATISNDNKVTINYTVTTTDETFNVNEVSILWNFAPGIDNNSSNYAKRDNTTILSGTHLFDLEKDSQFKENHYKIQANKNRIYVRVAAKTNGITNYSKIIELTIY